MSENDQGPREPVGSVAEEATALLAALTGLAGRGAGTGPAGRTHDDPPGSTGGGADVGTGAGQGAGRAAAETLRSLNEHLDQHIATGSAECTYCPLCQAIHLVRATSPEVRAHLATAANALVQAAATALAPHVPTDHSERVERIRLDDLDGDESGEER